VVRGITGFGGAMVMAPPLALLLGPIVAVPVVLLRESVAAAPICLTACAAVPLGVNLLVSTDPQLLRRAIAGIVIVFSLLLLRGWRYAGRQRLATSLGLGALSGAMTGAMSVGAPPVILYLLSGPDRVETTRANLTFYLVVISAAGLVMLWAGGVLDAPAAWTALALAPGYYIGLLGGLRLFAYLSEARFRRLTLLLLIAVSSGILVA
jgi:uncharacterized protein